jgi:tRNA nucleotidyltransferase/poly(A) polymerase
MGKPRLEDLPAELLRAAREVAGRLAEGGFRGWIVGGAVRDLALGRRPKDLDLCSAATPEQLEALFPRAVGVGRLFGTLTLPGYGFPLEVTTFRADGEYRDGRRPERVQFGASLEQDAARRDFTINALYLDPLSGELADPTGGFGDLERRRLKAVGDPALRFAEDRLRVLRLARFAGRLGFEIETATGRAAQAASLELGQLSAERVGAELRGLFGQPGYARGARVLRDLGVEEHLFGFALGNDAARRGDRAAEGLRRLEALESARPEPPGLALGLAVWWLPADPGEPLQSAWIERIGAEIEERLRPSRQESSELLALWRALGACAELERGRFPQAAAVRLLRGVPAPALLRLLEVEQDRATAALRQRLAGLVQSGAFAKRPALLDGRELQALGVPPGPALGAWLERLETWQIEGLLADREAASRLVQRRLAAGSLEPPELPA